MTTFSGEFADLEGDFQRRGIDTSAPGFYDHPAFLEAESRDSSFLNRYARYVDVREYDGDYLRRAGVEIPLIAETLHDLLIRDGREGACVDISGALSRILEKEGYWNYAVKGSLTISFPPGSGIRPKYFWSEDFGNFAAGHAWVVAPPFLVIDLSLRQQPYKGREREYLPSAVVATNAGTRAATVEDIFSPEALRAYGVSGLGRTPSLRILNPRVAAFTKVFPPRVIHNGATTLGYIPVAIGMTEEGLEALRYPFTGRYPMELYESEVIPRLLAVRNNGGVASPDT